MQRTIQYIDSDGRGPIDPTTGKRETSGFLKVMNSMWVQSVQFNKNAPKQFFDKALHNAAYSNYVAEQGGSIMGKLSDDLELVDYYPLETPYTLSNGGSTTTYFNAYGFESNYLKLDAGATSGSYQYLDENIVGSDFQLTTVEQGVISKRESFEKNEKGNYELAQTKSYQVDKGKYQTKKREDGSKYTYRDVTTTETVTDHKTGDTTTNTYKYEEGVE